MKNIIFTFTFILFFIGCNSTVRDESGPTEYESNFSEIQNLISSTKDVTYICFGDSTRAEFPFENHFVFENIKSALTAYNVSSINKSIRGQSARKASNSSSPETNWSDLKEIIPADGENTIINISLGINDDDSTKQELKDYLEKIITSIRESKPKTHFILTVPSRTLHSLLFTPQRFISIYKGLSKELKIPYINVPEEAMPLDENYKLDKDFWFRPSDDTHLTKEGQDKISDLILSKILP